MSVPLKVLILEDRESDANLMLHELRQAGYEPQAQRVDNERAFVAALEPSLDVIIADFALPEWTGLDALATVRASAFEIPVIVVTGVVGDENAAAIMRLGAADFLLKDRLARLGAAVANAVAGCRLRREHRAAEMALRAAHCQLNEMLERNPAVLYTARLGTAPVAPQFGSESVLRLLGFTPEETTGPGWWQERLHPEDRERVLATLHGHSGHDIFHVEYRLRHKAGHYCWVDDARRLVRDARGAPLEIAGVWLDVTERKQAEAERERLAADLRAARSELRTLSGLLPICASCKKIRDDRDEWQPVEDYIRSHSGATFTHGICPACARLLYPEIRPRTGGNAAGSGKP